MKKGLFVLSGLLGIFMFSSCSKDYLNTMPTTEVGTGTVTSTTSNAIAGLNGIAKAMTTQHAGVGFGSSGEGRIMRLYENYPSENFYFNAYASGWADLHNMKLFSNALTGYNWYAWYYYYQLITNANTIILGSDNIEGTEQEKNYVKAAALTFRAYSYEKLLRYYAPRWLDSNNGAERGLPLRLDDSLGDLAPSSVAEVYAQIYKDLDEAIALYANAIDRPSGQVWLPNVNVAHAVYARAALNRLDYAKAQSEAKMAEDGYPLMSNQEYRAGFYEPTSEWIFGSYGDASEQLWFWSYGTQFSCNGNMATKGETGSGEASIELIDRVPKTDIRHDLFITRDILPDADWSGGEESVIDNTFCKMKLEDRFEPELKAVREWIDNHSPAIASSLPAYAKYDFLLGGQLKFWVKDLPGVGGLPFIRSSEMVLVEAESAFKQGDEAGAIAALVRLNKDSGRNPDYSCNLSGDALWEEIVLYRNVELWGEGHSWSDYKRWNRPIVRHSLKDGGNAHPAIAVTIKPSDANNWTYVYPQREIDYNKLADDTKPTM